MNNEPSPKAAFYDLDGTLLSCNLVTTYAYYARNDRSIFKSIYQFLKVLVNVPLFFALDLYSRALFNVFFFRAYRGMHRDRLIGLADDLFEVTLKPSIYAKSEALVQQTREQGLPQRLGHWSPRLHGPSPSRFTSASTKSFATGSSSRTTSLPEKFLHLWSQKRKRQRSSEHTPRPRASIWKPPALSQTVNRMFPCWR